jgi:hypothetical protein
MQTLDYEMFLAGKKEANMFDMTRFFNDHLIKLQNSQSIKFLTQTRRLEIKRELMKIARAAKEALSRDGETKNLRPPLKPESKPRDAHTGGFWLSLGQLENAVSAELWLDHFSGWSSPHLWMGFAADSRGPIEKLVEFANVAGFKYEPIIFTARHITNHRPYIMVKPLADNQFDRLVYEDYANDRRYFGIYKKMRCRLANEINYWLQRNLKILLCGSLMR